MTKIQRLWLDEGGFIATTDLLLICTIVVIGTIVGLTTMRDQVVQEWGDLAAGVGALNQSFSISGATFTVNGATFSVVGSQFVDAADDCDTGNVAGSPAACISISVAAAHESQ